MKKKKTNGMVNDVADEVGLIGTVGSGFSD